MKKLNLKSMLNLRSFALLGILSVAVLAASCNKEDGFLPEPAIEDAELKSGNAVKKGDLSIAGIAVNAGIFTHLVDALVYVDEEEGTNLVGEGGLFSDGTDQFTVFAPTDEAFEALFDVVEGALLLPEGSVTSVRQLPSSLVLTVLQYHVTEGRRAANSVVPKNNSREIETLLGASFSVLPGAVISPVCTVKPDKTSQIVLPNQSAINGIVHVIDAVLLPVNLATVVEILTAE
jgi:uncharacterized surface protein with fasciclin (FAS1) repeats